MFIFESLRGVKRLMNIKDQNYLKLKVFNSSLYLYVIINEKLQRIIFLKNLELKPVFFNFIFSFIIFIIIFSFIVLISGFINIYILQKPSFWFLNGYNYDHFVKVIQTLSVFSILASLFLDHMRKIEEEQKIKIERTLKYLNTWREGNLSIYYRELHDVLAEICNDENNAHVFDSKQKHIIKEGSVEEYKKILNEYIERENNVPKKHAFSRFRSFLYEILVLNEQNYLDKKLLYKIFISEARDIWDRCYLYYQDSPFYAKKAAEIENGLFNNNERIEYE